MEIEDKIFRKLNIDYNKLLEYGFKEKDNIYTYSQNILDNNFKVIIQIQDNQISGKIYDNELNEEYINYKLENAIGPFVGKVRDEYSNILKDISLKCCTEKFFISDQANRLASYIIQKYNNYPEFPWKDDDLDGIFRNSKSKKWYALIMYINKNKLDNENRKVQVLNLKLDKDLIPNLIKNEGYYPAYHMNKKYWITILLDDTLSDEEIIEHLNESYQNSEK